LSFEVTDLRLKFILWITDPSKYEYISLASINADGEFKQRFFSQTELPQALDFIDENMEYNNMYFCPTPLIERKRKKDFVGETNTLWADLDECPPSALRLAPTVVLETSSNKYQAFWKLEDKQNPEDIELYNRVIAYEHRDEGCDVSGWDLTQLLRIPNTFNFKYDPVNIVSIDTEQSNVSRLYTLDNVEDEYSKKSHDSIVNTTKEPFPKKLKKVSGASILKQHGEITSNKIRALFQDKLTEDRSKQLYQLMKELYKAGFSKEQTLLICKDAVCNKFPTDQKLWDDVVRVYRICKQEGDGGFTLSKQKDAKKFFGDSDGEEDYNNLLSEKDRQEAEGFITIVDKYINWAIKSTDAAPQYHVAGIFTVLSCLMPMLRLYTSHSEIKANLWFMILGETTTSRKSTAMEMALDFLNEIDEQALLGSDGTVEGIGRRMSLREDRASLFHRDEFSGMLSSMSRKDYQAGMMEMLTKLYDGKRSKRSLSKEEIDIRNPYFVMLCGGTQEGIYSALTDIHVRSGFLPRFCFISAKRNIQDLTDMGPRTKKNQAARTKLIEELFEIKNQYPTTDLEEFKFKNIPINNEVELTDSAWLLFNRYLKKLLKFGESTQQPAYMMPMMNRLGISGLKAAMLIAATLANGQTSKIIIDDKVLKKAFYFVDIWKNYALEVASNIGLTDFERKLMSIEQFIIRANEKGVHKAAVMRAFKLDARDMDRVMSTLVGRNLVIYDDHRIVSVRVRIKSNKEAKKNLEAKAAV